MYQQTLLNRLRVERHRCSSRYSYQAEISPFHTCWAPALPRTVSYCCKPDITSLPSYLPPCLNLYLPTLFPPLWVPLPLPNPPSSRDIVPYLWAYQNPLHGFGCHIKAPQSLSSQRFWPRCCTGCRAQTGLCLSSSPSHVLSSFCPLPIFLLIHCSRWGYILFTLFLSAFWPCGLEF